MDKVIVKIWIPNKIQGSKIIEPGHYDEQNATILHWGVTYEELNNGIGQYTVVFIMLEDGSIYEAHPSNIKFIK